MSASQQVLPGMKQKLSALQKRAETFVLAEREANTKKDAAKRRKEEMIADAQRIGITTIKFTDDEGWTHNFEIDAHVKLKHTAFQAVKVEKVGVGD